MDYTAQCESVGWHFAHNAATTRCHWMPPHHTFSWRPIGDMYGTSLPQRSTSLGEELSDPVSVALAMWLEHSADISYAALYSAFQQKGYHAESCPGVVRPVDSSVDDMLWNQPMNSVAPNCLNGLSSCDRWTHCADNATGTAEQPTETADTTNHTSTPNISIETSRRALRDEVISAVLDIAICSMPTSSLDKSVEAISQICQGPAVKTGESPARASSGRTSPSPQQTTAVSACGTAKQVYTCHWCTAVFYNRRHLKEHVIDHVSPRPFHCAECGKGFTQRSSLRTHSRLHTGEKRYSCPFCNKRFSEVSTLTKHQRTHTGEQPFKCDYCHKRFSQSGNLFRHMRAIHNVSSAAR